MEFKSIIKEATHSTKEDICMEVLHINKIWSQLILLKYEDKQQEIL